MKNVNISFTYDVLYNPKAALKSLLLSSVSTTQVDRRPELTAGKWKPVTRQLGPSTRVVETGLCSQIRRRLGTESTRLDLEIPSRLDCGDSEV